MANLIILEGVSRTGKSSISKAFHDMFNTHDISIKQKMPEFIKCLPDFYHGIHTTLAEFIKTFPNETFILDRSFISELVYSRAFNRETHIGSDDLITNLLHDNNFILVNLTSCHREYLNRIPKDKKIYDYNEFNTQQDLFYHYFNTYKQYYDSKEWKSKFIELDTTKLNIRDCIELILKTCNENSIKLNGK